MEELTGVQDRELWAQLVLNINYGTMFANLIWLKGMKNVHQFKWKLSTVYHQKFKLKKWAVCFST